MDNFKLNTAKRERVDRSPLTSWRSWSLMEVTREPPVWARRPDTRRPGCRCRAAGLVTPLCLVPPTQGAAHLSPVLGIIVRHRGRKCLWLTNNNNVNSIKFYLVWMGRFVPTSHEAHFTPLSFPLLFSPLISTLRSVCASRSFHSYPSRPPCPSFQSLRLSTLPSKTEAHFF